MQGQTSAHRAPTTRRAERILCAAFEDGQETSKPMCACWVGDRASCFAVGYDDGSIMVWQVPPAALQGEPAAGAWPTAAHLPDCTLVARTVMGTAWHQRSCWECCRFSGLAADGQRGAPWCLPGLSMPWAP